MSEDLTYKMYETFELKHDCKAEEIKSKYEALKKEYYKNR